MVGQWSTRFDRAEYEAFVAAAPEKAAQVTYHYDFLFRMIKEYDELPLDERFYYLLFGEGYAALEPWGISGENDERSLLQAGELRRLFATYPTEAEAAMVDWRMRMSRYLQSEGPGVFGVASISPEEAGQMLDTREWFFRTVELSPHLVKHVAARPYLHTEESGR